MSGTPKERIAIRVDPDVLAALDQLAMQQQRSRSNQAEVLLVEALAALGLLPQLAKAKNTTGRRA